MGSLKPLYRSAYISAHGLVLLSLNSKNEFFSLSNLFLRMSVYLYFSDALLVFDDRYMRNDLTRLQIRCVNAAQGCEVVCSLESLRTHEDECEFAFMSCSYTGMKPHTELI